MTKPELESVLSKLDIEPARSLLMPPMAEDSPTVIFLQLQDVEQFQNLCNFLEIAQIPHSGDKTTFKLYVEVT